MVAANEINKLLKLKTGKMIWITGVDPNKYVHYTTIHACKYFTDASEEVEFEVVTNEDDIKMFFDTLNKNEERHQQIYEAFRALFDLRLPEDIRELALQIIVGKRHSRNGGQNEISD